MSNLDPSQIGSFLNQSYNPSQSNYLSSSNPYQFTPLASTSAYTHPQPNPQLDGFTPLSQHSHQSTQNTPPSAGHPPDLAVNPAGPSEAGSGSGTAVARPDPLAKGKKRKSSAGPGSTQPNGAPSEEETEKEKRQKIPRACDNCRRKKIRSVGSSGRTNVRRSKLTHDWYWPQVQPAT